MSELEEAVARSIPAGEQTMKLTEARRKVLSVLFDIGRGRIHGISWRCGYCVTSTQSALRYLRENHLARCDGGIWDITPAGRALLRTEGET